MKKALSLFLALAMTAALVACGGSGNTSSGTSSDASPNTETAAPVTPDATSTDVSNVANDPHVTLVLGDYYA